MYNLMRNPLIYLNNKLSNVIKIYVWFYCGNFTAGDTKENNTFVYTNTELLAREARNIYNTLWMVMDARRNHHTYICLRCI